MHNTQHHFCRQCGELFDERRWALGFKFCLPCGETLARQVRHTIVPMHKSNYIACFNRADLIGINNKGGLVK